MLTFYENCAGQPRRRALFQAKDELRKRYNRST